MLADALRPLTFGHGNAKLDEGITTFSLPAGHSCPFARECLSKSNPKTGAITDGPSIKVRCYAASTEARFPSVRRSRWRNFSSLRSLRSDKRMAKHILDSLSRFAGIVRVHDSGDFFSEAYYRAWLLVAARRPRTTFYWYTKCLPYWERHLYRLGDGRRPGDPPNVVQTASWGGRYDHLIESLGLRSVRIVLSEKEAVERKLDIDHDDSLAMTPGPDFALLIHGTQPPNTQAAAAMKELRDSGGFQGYGVTWNRKSLPILAESDTG
jgi:hypothetical protein